MEVCENCGRTIGKLETPYLFKQSTVCEECYNRLSGPAAVNPTAGNRPNQTPPKMPGRPAEAGWSERSPILRAINRGRTMENTSLRGKLRAMCWIGVTLWFGPFLLFAVLTLLSGDTKMLAGAQDCLQLSWLGAILTIGSMIALFLTKGTKLES